jgi:hypothetical protein
VRGGPKAGVTRDSRDECRDSRDGAERRGGQLGSAPFHLIGGTGNTLAMRTPAFPQAKRGEPANASLALARHPRHLWGVPATDLYAGQT